MSSPCREQGVSVPAESKGAPAESKGYTLRCSGDLLCFHLRFVVVAAKKKSLNLSVSWLTLSGLVDRLPVSAGKFRRPLQRHFLVDFQTEDISGKIFSCSKRACFAFANRARNVWTAFARSLRRDQFHGWSKTESALQRQRYCSVICQSIFKTKISLERSFPALNEHILLLWIERETAEQRPLEICRSIDFAMDRRLRPLASETLQRHLSIDFQNQDIIAKIFSCSERACFAFVNQTRNSRTASARSLPTHRFRDWLKTEAALKFNLLTGYPKYERQTLRSRHWLGESMKRRAEVENVFYVSFQRGKGKENLKLCMHCLKNHTQYFYTIVTYDTHKLTIFTEREWISADI